MAVLRRLPVLGATARYEPLVPVATALIVFGVAEVAHLNPFLAAFAAGVTVASSTAESHRAFGQFGELTTELLKLAALLAFGALLAQTGLDIGLGGWVMVIAVIIVARPAAVLAALAGTGLRGRDLATLAWFGPKGFASVVYALLVLSAGLDDGLQLYALIAVATAASIVVHSSTDVLVARWYDEERGVST